MFSYARVNKFDPRVPSNWYNISVEKFLSAQVRKREKREEKAREKRREKRRERKEKREGEEKERELKECRRVQNLCYGTIRTAL